MSNPTTPPSVSNPGNLPPRSPDVPPSQQPVPVDPARYTTQQEREMGVTDEKGRRIQPQTSFLMIGWTYVLVTGIAAVIVIVILRFMGSDVAGQ